MTHIRLYCSDHLQIHEKYKPRAGALKNVHSSFPATIHFVPVRVESRSNTNSFPVEQEKKRKEKPGKTNHALEILRVIHNVFLPGAPH